MPREHNDQQHLNFYFKFHISVEIYSSLHFYKILTILI